MNEEKVLEALAQLNATMQHGFSEMSGRFEAIESRLGKQEKTIKRTAKRQRLQASEIEQLKAVVQDLARQAPVRNYGDASAIRRDAAYHGFKRCGIDKVTAMKALREAGTIRPGHEDRNTDTIWLDGKCQRVIIVVTKE